jgi:hypothetical protein
MVRSAREIRRGASVLPRLVLIVGCLVAGAGYLATRPPGLPDRYHEVELTVTGMT